MMSHWSSINAYSYNSFSLSNSLSTTATNSNNSPLMPALPITAIPPMSSLPRVVPPSFSFPSTLF